MAWNRKQRLLICKNSGGGVVVEGAPRPGDSSYEIIDKPDGKHLVMNGGNHDFGLILEEANCMSDAIAAAERWRLVVAVMES